MIPARYVDGVRPIPMDVSVERSPDGLSILLGGGAILSWRFEDTHLLDEDGRIQLHRVQRGVDTGERLTFESAVFQGGFGEDVRRFRKGRAGEIGAARIAMWIGGAAASLAFVVFVLIPILARLLAPVVPLAWEKRLGEAVEPQILEMFGQGKASRLCADEAGNVALDKLVAALTKDLKTPFPIRVAVVDQKIVNAFALPGGRIFLFRPILERANNPDEVAGVLAHEIGHVIHRDAMRHVIHAGASSAVIGMMFGDVLGFSVLGSLGTMLFDASYSREIEHEADEVSVRLMGKAGADPRAINLFFGRMRKDEEKESGGKESAAGSLLSSFSSHPVTEERIRRVEALSEATPPPRAPILDRADWLALKAICRG